MIRAAEIAQRLGGHKVGSAWMAHCAAHDDNVPSLSIRDTRDGTVLVRCHAGCEQSAVIKALRSRGLWADKDPSLSPHRMRSTPIGCKPGQDDARRTDAA